MQKKAADGGNSDTMNLYGHSLLKGNGVPIDKKEAFCYLKMSTEKSNQSSILNCGLM